MQMFIKGTFLEVSKEDIDPLIKEDLNQVIVVLNQSKHYFYELFFLQQFASVKQLLKERYQMDVVNKYTVIFKARIVQVRPNHDEIKMALLNIFRNIKFFRVKFHSQDKQAIKQIREEIQSKQIHFHYEPQFNEQQIFIFEYKQNSNDEAKIQITLEKYKNFKRQEYIFPLDFFVDRQKIQQYLLLPFISGVIRKFKNRILEGVQNIRKKDLFSKVYVDQIQPFVQKNGNKIYPNLDKRCGITLIINWFGFGNIKLYNLLENFFERLKYKIIIAQEEVMRCHQDDIQQFFEGIGQNTIKLSSQAFAVFETNRDKQSLIRQLKIKEWTIAATQFEGLQFENLHHYEKQFNSQFLTLKNDIRIKAIYPNYIVFVSDRNGYDRVFKTCRDFLKDCNVQSCSQIKFESNFHLKTFMQHYAKNILIKPLKLVQTDGETPKLKPRCCKKDQDIVQRAINQQIQKMYQQIVSIPSLFDACQSTKFRSRKVENQFDVSTLKSFRMLLEDRLELVVRSYASIDDNNTCGVFMIDNIKNCSQLKEVLDQNNINITSFQNSLRAIKRPQYVMNFLLRKSRRYNSATAWYVSLKDSSKTKFQKDFYKIIQNETSEINLILTKDCYYLLQYLFQDIIKIAVNAVCKSLKKFGIKKITFYTNINETLDIQEQIFYYLKNLASSKEVNIKKCSSIYLNRYDIQKIVSLKYFTLKYQQNGKTKDLKSLSSFIFHNAISNNPKIKIPICFPCEEIKSQQMVEYCIQLYDMMVFKVFRGRAYEMKETVSTISLQLESIAKIMKKYFKNMDYIVIIGNEKGTVFSKNFAFFQQKQQNYKILQQLSINLKEQTIIIKQKAYRFQILQNLHLEHFLIDTHPSNLNQFYESIQTDK